MNLVGHVKGFLEDLIHFNKVCIPINFSILPAFLVSPFLKVLSYSITRVCASQVLFIKTKILHSKKLTIFNLINISLILTFMYTQSRFSFIQYLYITGIIIWFDANQTPTDYDPPNLGYNIILIFCYLRLVFRKWKYVFI